MENQLLHNMSYVVLTERQTFQGNRPFRISSSHISLGNAITISQSQIGSYYFYANDQPDNPGIELGWVLLFGFVLIILLVVVAIAAIRNCCTGDEEDCDSVRGIGVDAIELEDLERERRSRSDGGHVVNV